MSKKYGFCIGRMCQVLDVSRSGYYKFLTEGKNSKRASQNKVILKELYDLWISNRGVYGSLRLTAALRNKGYLVNRKRVVRLMNENGIKARRRKQFHKTTNSNHKYQLVPNLIMKKFKIQKLNQVWLSDITYIRTKEGFLYLAVVMDLCSRMPIGYTMDTHLRSSLVLEALQKAVKKRGNPNELIFHSDQGIQYASDDFKQQLKDYGITQSMSHKGNCYDNAPMESFFHTLKSELVHLEKFITRKQAEDAIKCYIDHFYIRRRLHSSLNYKSPKDFEESLSVTL